MKKLGDDKITYFDSDSVTFMCKCGSEVTLMSNFEDGCPICNREYVLKAKVEVYELEEGDEVGELEDGEIDNPKKDFYETY